MAPFQGLSHARQSSQGFALGYVMAPLWGSRPRPQRSRYGASQTYCPPLASVAVTPESWRRTAALFRLPPHGPPAAERQRDWIDIGVT